MTTSINKTYINLNRLYPFVNRRSVLNTQNKLLLYKTIFRPILTYGCAAWSFISDAQYKRLQTTQNKLLRLLTNSSRYISINELHEITGMARIKQYILDTAQKYMTQNIQNSELTRNITDIRRHHEHRHTHKLIHERLPIYENDR